jgi:hypothetical protein
MNTKDLTKQNLIEVALEQIKLDVHCGEYEPIEEFLKNCSVESLIDYLPEEDSVKFKHLKYEK